MVFPNYLKFITKLIVFEQDTIVVFPLELRRPGKKLMA